MKTYDNNSKNGNNHQFPKEIKILHFKFLSPSVGDIIMFDMNVIVPFPINPNVRLNTQQSRMI